MKATCKSCGASYLKKESYSLEICPQCLVNYAMHVEGYLPGTDAVFFTNQNVFFVVEVESNRSRKLMVYTKSQFKIHQYRHGRTKYLFKGQMKDCLDYVKDHE